VRDLHAAAARCVEMLAQMMASVATRRDERVFNGKPPNATIRSVCRDDIPRGGATENRRRAADEMRQQHQRRTDAVTVACAVNRRSFRKRCSWLWL
jgi:hypothetical protein